jgi:NADPH-dependent 2,4-dienoyl-CoA reductase/sulfur reductase-like enzyme/ferredoxin
MLPPDCEKSTRSAPTPPAGRITDHPILRSRADEHARITLSWQGTPIEARAGEPIAAALVAEGVRVFGHHEKDGAPQGLFCANGRCAQCLVVADGKPVKACVTPARDGMRVEPLAGRPALAPLEKRLGLPHEIEEIAVPVLVVGGGPSGMAAATELGARGVKTRLVDDKPKLGGKLVLQTHRFFGSANAVHAGTRGIDIAARLERELRKWPSVEVSCNTTAVAVFSDQKVGLLRGAPGGTEYDARYVLVKPDVLVVATGARERFLTFRGNTLPGVIGAGAFQTLVNRDLVRPAKRIFVVGGGNVGLITAYHALQVDIQVAGLVEALPKCPGYLVHEEKLARQGVPIFTSHTILSANGTDGVESVTIAQVDAAFRPIPGTERSFACDAVLVAVGLDPEDELHRKALAFGMTSFAAGDAEEIAEASSAMFAGKIRGLEAARALGVDVGEIPPEWRRAAAILKSKPGATRVREEPAPAGIHPVLHCTQEIPCDPCSSVCPEAAIHIDPDDIRKLPVFIEEVVGKTCVGCEKCVTICPGQAITIVDFRRDAEHPFVTVPHEMHVEALHAGSVVTALDVDGHILGNVEVVAVHAGKVHDRTAAVKLRAPREVAQKIAGIRTSLEAPEGALPQWVPHLVDDAILCRCERVTAGAVRALVKRGYRDINEIKTVTRLGMGACGAKTCGGLVERIFMEEGVSKAEVHVPERRPLVVEVPLGVLGGFEGEGRDG